MRHLAEHELAAADPIDLVTIREAARLVGVQPATVRKWVHDGRLGCVVVQMRQHVLLPHAAEVELETRRSTRGRPRDDNGVTHGVVCRQQ